MVKDFIAARDCPRDCPFLDRVACGQTMLFCSFAIYSDCLEPYRFTRTEIDEDGTVNYNIPPNCNVYDKYKDKKDVVEKAKRSYKRKGALRLDRKYDPDLVVTGHKHPATQKHRHHFD